MSGRVSAIKRLTLLDLSPACGSASSLQLRVGNIWWGQSRNATFTILYVERLMNLIAIANALALLNIGLFEGEMSISSRSRVHRGSQSQSVSTRE